MTTPLPPGGGNLVVTTLGNALASLWNFFWPVFAPLGFILVVAFCAYIVRKVMDVG